MSNSGFKYRLPALLLLLLIPGVVVTVVVRKNRTRKANEGLSGGHLGKVKQARPLPQSEQDDAETASKDEEALRSSQNPQTSDEPEGDGGELAVFSTKGTKPVKFGKLPWSPGMTWKVDTYYKNLQHPEHAEWAPKPIEWKFTVRGSEKIDGHDVWVLDVEPTDLTDMPFNPGGSVYVSMEDNAILAVRDRIQENGAVRDRYIRFDDAEGTATSSFLPVDLPEPGTDGLERSATTAAMAPNPFQPDPANVAPPKTSGKVIDVEFEADGDTIRQRWDTANPYWPAYSGTPSKVSYLKNEP